MTIFTVTSTVAEIGQIRVNVPEDYGKSYVLLIAPCFLVMYWQNDTSWVVAVQDMVKTDIEYQSTARVTIENYVKLCFGRNPKDGTFHFIDYEKELTSFLMNLNKTMFPDYIVSPDCFSGFILNKTRI